VIHRKCKCILMASHPLWQFYLSSFALHVKGQKTWSAVLSPWKVWQVRAVAEEFLKLVCLDHKCFSTCFQLGWAALTHELGHYGFIDQGWCLASVDRFKWCWNKGNSLCSETVFFGVVVNVLSSSDLWSCMLRTQCSLQMPLV